MRRNYYAAALVVRDDVTFPVPAALAALEPGHDARAGSSALGHAPNEACSHQQDVSATI
jgi:hypothetical protein